VGVGDDRDGTFHTPAGDAADRLSVNGDGE
jgi:hypothetical protein